jgi:magnesium-transporting ATPase (P-type)
MYILNSNMAEAVPSVFFLFSAGLVPLPLTVMQILSIDLGTDMLPALGLGTELPEKGIMDRAPRSQNDRLMNKWIIIKAFFWYGLLASIFSMTGYFLVNYMNGWPNVPLASSGIVYREATTMALTAIVFSQVGAVLNARTVKQSVFSVGLFKNRKVLIGIVFEICLMAFMIYVPFMQDIFNTAPLSLWEWIFLFLIPIPTVALDEIRKYFVRKKDRERGE